MEKRTIWSWFKNKYTISLAFFAIYILIFSQNNLIERLSYIRQLRHLEQQKEYYQQQIKENSEKLHQLKTNPANLEKFAREEYLMKKPDEDVYVIVKEEK